MRAAPHRGPCHPPQLYGTGGTVSLVVNIQGPCPPYEGLVGAESAPTDVCEPWWC